MKNRPVWISAIGLGIVFACASSIAASAHVMISPSDTPAGTNSVLTFSFSHGCKDSPTNKLTIDIPSTVVSVFPTISSEWNIETVRVPFTATATPSASNPAASSSTPSGEPQPQEATSTRIGQVIYTAKTPVPNGLRGAVEIGVLFPENMGGQKVAFPTLQTCESGEINWSQIEGGTHQDPSMGSMNGNSMSEGSMSGSQASENSTPAPIVTVTEAMSSDNSNSAALMSSSGSTDDILARVLGLFGLVVGAIGVVIAIVAVSRKHAR